MSDTAKPRLLAGYANFQLFSRTLAAFEEVMYEVSVDIPVAQFYVLPVNPAVFIQLQHLQWDFRSKSFKPFLTRFNVLNSSGGFNARLDKAAVLQRGFDHPGDIIDLQVRLKETLKKTS
ncbi:hypothetical protein [Pseudomonas sp.]|uniref:hypothetical protein n=1 Tax=Pseudomonas sp. TaxID=306 RepID=UPI003981D0AC